MAQRSFFWPRHGGNAAPNRENNDNNSNSTGYSGPTEHSGGSQTLAALEAHQHQHQHRQPGNSTGGAGASSFASSHSSSHSPSPSPSIDPYASAVRSMLADAARQTADSSVPRLSAGAGAGATLPANLRRASRTHSESAPLPPSPLLLEGRAWGGGPVPQQQKAWSRMSQDQPQASVAAVAHAQTSAAAASAPAPVLASSSVAPHGSRDTRCEQIVQNFYAKTAQVIAHLRGGGNGGDAEAGSSTMYASSASSSVADVGATGRRINKWFSMSLEDVGDAREEAKFWRNAVAATSGTHQHQQQQSQQPPPMIIEVCLDVSGVQPDDELQVADVAGRPWSVDLELAAPSASRPQHLDAGYRRRARATAVVLESWRLDLDVGAIPLPVPDLPRVYKKAIVFFRSLYAYASLLPCAATAQQQQQSHSGAGRRQQLPVFCVFRTEASPRARTIDLGVGLTGTDSFLGSHTFEPVATPMGAFAMSVQYRRECSFACAGPHSPAQHDALGTAGTADDTYFTPTLSSRSGSHFSAGRASRLHTRPDDHASYANYANYANQTSSSGERGLAVPSVNPFRARPLSMGSSAMLGAAGNGGGGRRNSVVEPMFVTHSHDPHAHPASLPRHVGGYGFSFGGSGSGSRMRAASVAAGAHVSRPHSLDQRAEAILGRLSTSAATDSGSGSTLHRSVMLRRLGDSLSPSESHRSADAGLRVSAAAAPETHGSPPRIGLPGARTIPISATGRSTLGVTPFKSPSLSESPAPRFVSTFADDSGDHETVARRLTISGSGGGGGGVSSSSPGHTASVHQQLVSRIADSPSSTGSGGHSRGLSSSFGNRRAGSMRGRQASLLGTSAATDSHYQQQQQQQQQQPPLEQQPEPLDARRRRRTVVGSLGWGEGDARDIDDFIRMVDSKQPLRLVRKDSSRKTSAPPPQPPLSAGPALRHTPTNDVDNDGCSLRRFQGILDEFSGITRDMETSVMVTGADRSTRNTRGTTASQMLRLEPLTATPEEDADSAAAILFSSPPPSATPSSSFRRPAMPNPLLMAADRAQPPSRPLSTIETTGTPLPPHPSAAKADSAIVAELAGENNNNAGSSVDMLRSALSELNIEANDKHWDQMATRTRSTRGRAQHSDTNYNRSSSLSTAGVIPTSRATAVWKPYVRSDAEDLDVASVIAARKQRSTRGSSGYGSSDEDHDGLGIALPQQPRVHHRPQSRHQSPDVSRGKSQPTSRMPELMGLVPAPSISTPQPQPQPHGNGGPFSHRSDYVSGNSHLGALLGMSDHPVPSSSADGSRGSPRSTPGTPRHAPPGASPMAAFFQIQRQNQQNQSTVDRAQWPGASAASGSDAPRIRPSAHQRSSRPPLADAPAQPATDPLRSNFPPLSFIIPRNRFDGRPADSTSSNNARRQDGPLASSELEIRGAARQSELDSDNDDDELMFQMESSSTIQR